MEGPLSSPNTQTNCNTGYFLRGFHIKPDGHLNNKFPAPQVGDYGFWEWENVKTFICAQPPYIDKSNPYKDCYDENIG